MRTFAKAALILLFLAGVTIPGHAARAAAPGPMSGHWKIQAKTQRYKSGATGVKWEISELDAIISDSAGAASPITIVGTDQDGNPFNLSGQRVNGAFMAALITECVAGKAIVTKGIAKNFTARGAAESADSIDFIYWTGKRAAP